MLSHAKEPMTTKPPRPAAHTPHRYKVLFLTWELLFHTQEFTRAYDAGGAAEREELATQATATAAAATVQEWQEEAEVDEDMMADVD